MYTLRDTYTDTHSETHQHTHKHAQTQRKINTDTHSETRSDAHMRKITLLWWVLRRKNSSIPHTVVDSEQDEEKGKEMQVWTTPA